VTHPTQNMPTASPIAETQRCPVCGLPPFSDVTRENRGVMISDLICGFEHLWIVKWVMA
jgi:hypothetical protein